MIFDFCTPALQANQTSQIMLSQIVKPAKLKIYQYSILQIFNKKVPLILQQEKVFYFLKGIDLGTSNSTLENSIFKFTLPVSFESTSKVRK